jgi:ribulose-5-phosphate 4-epimerase/fuculose-1-phosphate aldolase
VNETGSVKFSVEHVANELPEFEEFAELNTYRRKLFELGLIGVDASGIGFGNVSIRIGRQFYITGSETGKFPHLTISHYAGVTAYDFEKNWLRCEGPVVASSESLTHAAVYESEPSAMAIVHCHDLRLWAALQNKVPTTPKGVEYGTPDMAYAVQRLFNTTNVRKKKLFVMAAHEGGLVTFGKDLEQAFSGLIDFRNELSQFDRRQRK